MGYPSSHLYTVKSVSFPDTFSFFDIEYFFIHHENVHSTWSKAKQLNTVNHDSLVNCGGEANNKKMDQN